MAEANEKMVKVGGKEIAQSEIDKALALLEKQKLQRAKQAEKNKNNPDVIAKRRHVLAHLEQLGLARARVELVRLGQQ